MSREYEAMEVEKWVNLEDSGSSQRQYRYRAELDQERKDSLLSCRKTL